MQADSVLLTPNPRIEAILMIEPPAPLATMRRAASWPTRNTPSRLTASTERHSSSLVLVKNEPDGTPALLIRIVTGPSAAAASKARFTEAGSVTSSSTASALPPVASISAARLCNLSSRRAASTTSAPARLSTCAKCRPSPDEAPVTSADLPFRENGFSCIF
jgi:hypothetical protein